MAGVVSFSKQRLALLMDKMNPERKLNEIKSPKELFEKNG